MSNLNTSHTVALITLEDTIAQAIRTFERQVEHKNCIGITVIRYFGSDVQDKHNLQIQAILADRTKKKNRADVHGGL